VKDLTLLQHRKVAITMAGVLKLRDESVRKI
jgi:hypothetical protein